MTTQEELKKLHVIKKALSKTITQREAGEILGISLRQVRRISKKIREEGDKGIVHKLRGKKSNSFFSEEVKNKVIELYKTKYRDFGPTLATEKLFEIEEIKLSKETLRRWFLEEDIAYKKRKKRPHRQWRERRGHFGTMIQMDGSHHDWFEGRGTKCVFMGYIDDATSKVFGRFYEYEGTIPAMDSFKRYIEKHGIPLSVYLDNHTTYKSWAKATIEEELSNKKPLSQFGRALKELGIKIIYAHSPQAKGRIERLFNTFQDRLVKEMRLKGINEIEGANKLLENYLPSHNKKFSIEAKEKGDMHRAIPAQLDLDNILCIKAERALRNDFTISYEGKIYQIEDNIRGKKVTVEERINGTKAITYKEKELKFREIEVRSSREEDKKEENREKSKKTYIPPLNHPWRKYKIKTGIEQGIQNVSI